MALNWVLLNSKRSPIPLPHELILRTIDSGADLTVIVPDSPPSGSSASGGSGGSKRLKENGTLWLTDQRVCMHSSFTLLISMNLSEIPLLEDTSSANVYTHRLTNRK